MLLKRQRHYEKAAGRHGHVGGGKNIRPYNINNFHWLAA